MYHQHVMINQALLCVVMILYSAEGHLRKKLCGSLEYNLYTQICCGDQLFNKTGETQCCGKTPYHVIDPGTLCCDGTLYQNTREGCLCVDPSRETLCQAIRHPQPYGHCCGQELFTPSEELCCAGHRWPKSPGRVCCGADAYDIRNHSQKCCSGHLHPLEDISRAQCCGTLLVEDSSKQVCCSSSQWQLVYRRQSNFSCCGHRYYNTSLHSCCAGALHIEAAHDPSKEGWQEGHYGCCRVFTDLNSSSELLGASCHPVLGTLESSYQNGPHLHVVLTSVTEIHLTKGRVTPVQTPVLLVMDHCSCPPLEQGTQYLACINKTALFVPSQDFQGSLLHVILSVFNSTKG